MVILKGHIIDKCTTINNSLPKPQPGMTVSYDGLGNPTFIKINGQPYSDNNTKTKIADSMISASSSGYYSNYGAISWYEDVHGQSNHVLSDYDCATDQMFDNCPLGTYIKVQDRDSGIWGGFHKWDIGALQAQPEKRIVDIWNRYIFTDVFGIDDPVDTGLLHNGYYYHY
ncbi:hypothetical protein CSC2_28060 [Clostridium zeae]|uniref:Uncharacterized protein n=1 Tax=Clostridium zeae TaxID=2759022 RepID=A0ABQ1ECB9_9CLOT|nr:hypothetical protein [Clostridium zeae]GFZ32280.1 hypothetical protein CSC2_28060 [Clostridium zeae]